jgi:ubiquinol-cytochrome c reductase cytochrome b subunit
MFTSLWKWLNERWPLTTFFQWGLTEEIAGGASYAYIFGSATLVIFLLQVISGIWQMFYYVPSIDHAYQSLSYLRISVGFGWLVHGIHYWGAQAMILLVGFHALRVFIWGAYKNPRQLTWLLGVGLLLLTAGMVFTGALLPWDEKGYFAAEVGTSIAGTVPYIGDWLKRLIRGGETMGQLTLSRFFILHVAILPAVLMAFIGLHLIAFRKFGSVGPWREKKRKRIGLFWPDQIYWDVLTSTVLILIIIVIITYINPPFSGPADPVDNSYQPKPEWNFLFLYQALKVFKGGWEPVGTVGLPLVMIILFILLPFLDRKIERNPLKRSPVMFGGLVFLGGVLALTVTGYYSHPGGAQGVAATGAQESTTHLSSAAQEGSKLVHSLGCMGCHSINGTGGTIAPDLSHEVTKGHSKIWIITQVRDPKKHDPTSIMPAFTNISNQQVADIADYLLSLGTGIIPAAGSTTRAQALPSSSTGTATSADTTVESTAAVLANLGPPGLAVNYIGNHKHGGVLFRQRCESCHGIEGKGGIPNPGSVSGVVPALNPIDSALFNNDANVFAENIDRFIQHGSTPPGPDPSLHMQNFGDSHVLTQQQIAQLEAYVLKLNGVDRAQLRHPGLPPKEFLLISLTVFGIFVIGLGIYRIGKT